MPVDEQLVARVRKHMASFDYLCAEKNMFGGITFLYNGKMACGVQGNRFIVRVLEPLCSAMIKKDPLIQVMDFTGKPMKEFVSVQPERVDDDIDLLMFIMLGVTHATHKVLEEEKKTR